MENQLVHLKSYTNRSGKQEVIMVLDHESLWQEDSFTIKADIAKDGVDEKGKTIYYPFEQTKTAARILCDIILEANNHIPYWYLIETEGYTAFEDITNDFEKSKAVSFTLSKLNSKTLEKRISEQRGLIQIDEIHWKADKQLMKIKYRSYRLGKEELPSNPMQSSMFDEPDFAEDPTMLEIQEAAYKNKSSAYEKKEITFTIYDELDNDKGVFSPFGPQIHECYKMLNEEMIDLWKKSTKLKRELSFKIDEYGNEQ
ncbi:MAG: hypothetical protein AB8G11_07845 [Saprospiraceae bacterium]